MITTINRFTEQDVESLKSVLQSKQDAAPPKTLTARQVILQLKPELEYLHSKGWTWADITILLSQQDLTLSSSTLRDYLKSPASKKQVLPPLSLEALDDLNRSTNAGEVKKALNSRTKVTLSRFLKHMQTGISEGDINKMNKAALVTSITGYITNEQSHETIPDELNKPRKAAEKVPGEHEDLFNIDLGI
ncbi:MAG: hypothetical protein HOM11_02230 [Methylococcales bacterium]|jgi:hypothetical protein|nr:hypothetical protein [Methylococcales bacterium]MBT7444824.1 hypothetical protein [Methylococcales bacterium]